MPLNEIPKYINLETRSLIESALEEGLARGDPGRASCNASANERNGSLELKR